MYSKWSILLYNMYVLPYVLCAKIINGDGQGLLITLKINIDNDDPGCKTLHIMAKKMFCGLGHHYQKF